MNQVFASGLALIIALILWSSNKKSKGSVFFNSQKDSSSKAQLQKSLVVDKSFATQQSIKLNNKESKPFLDKPTINSIETKKQLAKLMSSNPSNRLLAIEIASKWGNREALPFLRRGLKDSDNKVVIASAAAISSYKGQTRNPIKSQASRPPRNVSLMR